MGQVHSSKKGLKAEKVLSQGTKCAYEGLKIFGDVWTLLIINSLKEGEKRFCELQRTLDNINPVTLTNRLKKLEKLGFIQRREEIIDKLSVSYALTQKGVGMIPILHQIEAYARKYLE